MNNKILIALILLGVACFTRLAQSESDSSTESSEQSWSEWAFGNGISGERIWNVFGGSDDKTSGSGGDVAAGGEEEEDDDESWSDWLTGGDDDDDDEDDVADANEEVYSFTTTAGFWNCLSLRLSA